MYIVHPVVAMLFIVRPCVGLSIAVSHAVAVFTNCVQKTVGLLVVHTVRPSAVAILFAFKLALLTVCY